MYIINQICGACTITVLVRSKDLSLWRVYLGVELLLLFLQLFCNEGNMFDIKTAIAVILNEFLYFCHHGNNYRCVLIFGVFGYHASHLFLFLTVSP